MNGCIKDTFRMNNREMMFNQNKENIGFRTPGKALKGKRVRNRSEVGGRKPLENGFKGAKGRIICIWGIGGHGKREIRLKRASPLVFNKDLQ